jgi:hypothetical protein
MNRVILTGRADNGSPADSERGFMKNPFVISCIKPAEGSKRKDEAQ